MQRILIGVASAVAAMALASTGGASQASVEGLHGAATVDFTERGFQGRWHLTADAQRIPSGDLVGEFTFTGRDAPLSDYVKVSSEPTYLEIEANTACVASDVTSVKGAVSDWPTPPVQFFMKVRNVDDGPDVIGVFASFQHLDPAVICSNATPTIAVTEGGFTINH